jgi:hypothetical protein
LQGPKFYLFGPNSHKDLSSPPKEKDRKITLPDPKSGKESEIVFIPQKIADRWIENLYG